MEFFGVAINDARNGIEPGFAIRGRRLPVGLQDGLGNGHPQIRRDLLPPGDTIERLLFVETRHFDRPFDRGAIAANFKPAIAATRDGNNPAIEFRGIASVDFQFLFAGGFALLKRRVVEKRQSHGPLDLQCTIAAEKDHRGVRIDPLGAAFRAKAGVFQKIKYAILKAALRGRADLLRTHGREQRRQILEPDHPPPETGAAPRASSGPSHAYRRSSRWSEQDIQTRTAEV